MLIQVSTGQGQTEVTKGHDVLTLAGTRHFTILNKDVIVEDDDDRIIKLMRPRRDWILSELE